jgi:hypothetical protein
VNTVSWLQSNRLKQEELEKVKDIDELADENHVSIDTSNPKETK